MNKQIEQLVKDTVLATLADNAGSLVANMAKEILNKKVDPNYGDTDGLYWPTMYLGRRSSAAQKITYLEYLARQEVQASVQRAIKAWVKGREGSLKKQIAERIDAEAIADSYVRALVSTFENDAFELTVTVENKERDYD